MSICQAIGVAHQRVFHVGSRSEYHLSSSYNVVGVTNLPLLKSIHTGAPDHTDHPTFYCFHLKRVHCVIPVYAPADQEEPVPPANQMPTKVTFYSCRHNSTLCIPYIDIILICLIHNALRIHKHCLQ